MMPFSTTPYLKGLFLMCMLCLATLSQNAKADNAVITLLHNQVTLSYPQEVRFLQLLQDAYSQSQYQIYPLGSALINPNKQSIVTNQKRAVLRQLAAINTPAAKHIANYLNRLNLVYHEDMVFDFTKVRIKPKLNPLVKGEYSLLLAQRPNHITVFDAAQDLVKKVPLNKSGELRDYLAQFSGATKEQQPYDSVWIIQADRSIYQAKDLQWKNTLYFLSPGAMVFIGLPNLSDEYRDLNANIAHLFAFRLEL
ncbi:capsule biosynthesis GfcC D2 domain-containing protein [Marinomonas sp. BSi20584]|uniref:capsule biosynthesis GfcC D2 domain-containing protein n=1 Tax=Marinomonas sp. BSi20584 TaxID=1594462 RepID=UPI000C1F57B2|nr:capsule biosynthesis GfcC D2 domain-containing protein [Marinomonas sp. BSi20584]PJE53243.1 hypothetical protein TY87_21815 [Marinomonas sp. BSi20584]